MPDEITDREPTREESEEGRKNFAVISTAIKEIDVLELDVKGHRRSLFSWNENGTMDMKWLTP